MSFRFHGILIVIVLFGGAKASAQLDNLDISLSPKAKEYCHVIRFPQAWAIPRVDDKTGQRIYFGSDFGEYEFRTEAPQGTQFFVGAFTEFFGPRYDTTNHFRVDLSDPKFPIQAASREAWDTATVVAVTRKSRQLAPSPPPENKPLGLFGFQFAKSGQLWDLEFGRLSPDQSWLVLQSEALKSGPGGTRVFFDVFKAKTGEKVLTIEGTFSSSAADGPGSLLAKTGWVTD